MTPKRLLSFLFLLLAMVLFAHTAHGVQKRCAKTGEICGGFVGVTCCKLADQCDRSMGTAGRCRQSNVLDNPLAHPQG